MNPVFLVSVPRSGSTMLRMVLDSHPLIFAGVELPWIGGNYRSDGYGPEVSLRCLYRRMINSTEGGKTLDSSEIKMAFRSLICTTVKRQLCQSDKEVWVEKTPDNLVQVPFLAELFPTAKFIRVIRDGRDVALSTMKVNWNGLNYFIDETPKNLRWVNVRIAINRRLFAHLPKRVQESLLTATAKPANGASKGTIFYPIANTFYNALHRWKEWNRIYEADVMRLGMDELTVRYEDLLLKPTDTLGRIFDFIGVAWDPRVLEYGQYSHHTREGDVGATSAMKFSTIEANNAYKWKTRLTRRQRRLARKHFDDYLAYAGYPTTPR